MNHRPSSYNAADQWADQNRTRLNLAYMTSVREIVGDEMVGQVYPHNGSRLVGTLEHLALTLEGDNDLSKRYNLVLVLTDDDGAGEELFNPPYEAGRPWDENAVSTIRDYNDRILGTPTLDELTVNIPSNWRKIALTQPQVRSERKAAWEEQIVAKLDEYDVDVLLLDSFMVIIGKNIPGDRGLLLHYESRIVNLHPAITSLGNPNRLPGKKPTIDAITRLQGGYVEMNGRRNTVTRHDKTGATLHIVDHGEDTGPVIYDSEKTHVFENDTPDSLRYRNYDTKNTVAKAGLLKFADMPRIQKLPNPSVPFVEVE